MAQLADRNRHLSPLLALALLTQAHCSLFYDSREPVGRCGDGIRQEQAGEECDDGNTIAGDKCSPHCTIEVCGNGILDHGEECDQGKGNDDGGDCTHACQLARCGDGQLRTRGNPQIPYERCDDGNTLNGDGCNPQCELEGRLTVIAGHPGGKGVADGIGNVARFGGISGMAADSRYVYVYDGGACAIRRFDPATHTVDTISGGKDGCAGTVADGSPTQANFGAKFALLAKAGNYLFVGESNLLRRVDLGDTSPEQFYLRTCSAIADADSLREGGIQALTFAKGQDETSGTLYVGTATALYQFPIPCACQPYSSAADACRLRRVAGAGQAASRLKDGKGADARFLYLSALSVADDGAVYIADGAAIRRFDPLTQAVTTVAGAKQDSPGVWNYAGYGAVDGKGLASQFGTIEAIKAHNQDLYVLEQHITRPEDDRFPSDADESLAIKLGWSRLRKIDLADADYTVSSPIGAMGSVGGGVGEVDGFGSYSRFIRGTSLAITWASGGRDLLMIGTEAAIRAVDLATGHVATAAGSLVSDATFHNVSALATHRGKLYAMSKQQQLLEISLEEAAPHEELALCPTVAGAAHQVVAAVVDAGDPQRDDDDQLYLVDDGGLGICSVNLKTKQAQQVWRDPNAETTTKGDFLGWGVSGLAVDGNNLYLVASFTSQILRLDLSDPNPKRQPEAITVPASLKGPQKAVFVQGRLYVTSHENNVVVGIDLSTGASVVLGNGEARTSDSPRCAEGANAPACPTTAQGRLATVNFCHPLGIATNGKQLFVSEGFCPSQLRSFQGNAVRQIELDTFNVTTLLGPAGPARLVEGSGANAAVNFAADLSFDTTTRSLYLADAWENVLARID